ncbi:MAG: thermonuclease family protein [Deltaproteobacteria bacterium]|nr:thermonuclease family protein [Deltaproteobacteria bacterium]
MVKTKRAYHWATALPVLIAVLVLSLCWREGGLYAKEPGRYALVKKVIDGDTIAVEGGDRVRYLGIDAPESGEPFYEEARQRNAALVGGKTVRLVICGEERRDKYGRLLAWVYSDGVLVNRTLLSEGLARLFIIPPCGLEKAGDFDKAEKEAIGRKAGLWSANTQRNDKAVATVAPSEAALHEGEYVKVRGRVSYVHKAKNVIFMDFSDARGKEFTAVIFKTSFSEFKSAGVDPLKYRGKMVTVSGKVSMYRGRPEIVVKLPRQISID